MNIETMKADADRLQKKLGIIKQEIERAEELCDLPHVRRYKPVYLTAYYFITSGGVVDSVVYTGDATDMGRLAVGNYYPNALTAHRALMCMIVTERLRNIAGDYTPDWDSLSPKYVLRYDRTTYTWYPVQLRKVSKGPVNAVVFPSMETAVQALREVGGDLSYLLGDAR